MLFDWPAQSDLGPIVRHLKTLSMEDPRGNGKEWASVWKSLLDEKVRLVTLCVETTLLRESAAPFLEYLLSYQGLRELTISGMYLWPSDDQGPQINKFVKRFWDEVLRLHAESLDWLTIGHRKFLI